MKYIYIFLIIYGLKVFYNLSQWLYGYYLRAKWVSYFNKKNQNVISYTYQIEKYLYAVPNSYIVRDIFQNTSYSQSDMMKSFYIAHGYYKHCFLENFNPYYWIKLIIYLPQTILLYLNPKSKEKTLHFFNFMYWICGIIFTIYNDEITSYIKQVIELIFKYFTNN